MDLLDYYDGEHVWDDAASVKRLKLHRIKGYLFGSNGKLDQEFESIFYLSTGIYSRRLLGLLADGIGVRLLVSFAEGPSGVSRPLGRMDWPIFLPVDGAICDLRSHQNKSADLHGRRLQGVRAIDRDSVVG